MGLGFNVVDSGSGLERGVRVCGFRVLTEPVKLSLYTISPLPSRRTLGFRVQGSRFRVQGFKGGGLRRAGFRVAGHGAKRGRTRPGRVGRASSLPELHPVTTSGTPSPSRSKAQNAVTWFLLFTLRDQGTGTWVQRLGFRV